jgi:hypothetical protein
MTPIEIKYGDLHVGKAVFLLHDDFELEEPFFAVLTVALGEIGEDASSYYQCLIASPDCVRDRRVRSQSHRWGYCWSHRWITRRIDGATLRAKLAELVYRANMSAQPGLEAAKYLRWECSQDAWGRKGIEIGENLSRQFFFDPDAK